MSWSPSHFQKKIHRIKGGHGNADESLLVRSFRADKTNSLAAGSWFCRWKQSIWQSGYDWIQVCSPTTSLELRTLKRRWIEDYLGGSGQRRWRVLVQSGSSCRRPKRSLSVCYFIQPLYELSRSNQCPTAFFVRFKRVRWRSVWLQPNEQGDSSFLSVGRLLVHVMVKTIPIM